MWRGRAGEEGKQEAKIVSGGKRKWKKKMLKERSQEERGDGGRGERGKEAVERKDGKGSRVERKELRNYRKEERSKSGREKEEEWQGKFRDGGRECEATRRG